MYTLDGGGRDGLGGWNRRSGSQSLEVGGTGLAARPAWQSCRSGLAPFALWLLRACPLRP
eukprot:scaffold12267_cov120-Isochrysis_galbana.AAC.4